MGSSAVSTQARHFLPVLAAICRTKQRGIFNPGVNGIRIGQRRFQMPDTLERPRMLCAIKPLVR
jgi:hypothetical protein